jgi:hypothetical protein
MRALANQFALQFGKCSHQVKEKTPLRGGGVDVVGEAFKLDLTNAKELLGKFRFFAS